MTQGRAPVRVLIVEDSATQAHALKRMLESEGDFEVVHTAADALEAVRAVAKIKPGLVTMDLDIPGGGGQHAIERIMAESPAPILVLSGIFENAGAPTAVEALAAGAVDALPKPRLWTDRDAQELRRQARRVARVAVIGRRARRRPAVPSPPQPPPPAPRRARHRAVVAVAASTGGPAALATVLEALEGLPAPVLVVQHIHASFAPGFSTWLRGLTGGRASLAEEGETLRSGCIHVAPGDQHMRVDSRGRIHLHPDPVSVHRPSADELFRSVAKYSGPDAIGVVLTGMGADGADGARAIRAAGGTVIVQDEATSVVWGMPRAAIDRGAAAHGHPLDEIAAAIRAAVVERV